MLGWGWRDKETRTGVEREEGEAEGPRWCVRVRVRVHTPSLVRFSSARACERACARWLVRVCTRVRACVIFGARA